MPHRVRVIGNRGDVLGEREFDDILWAEFYVALERSSLDAIRLELWFEDEQLAVWTHVGKGDWQRTIIAS